LVLDRKTEIIFKKFQFKLKLKNQIIQYAKTLYYDLLQRNSLQNESPYLLVGICIFTVSRIEEQSTTLEDIAAISHIREEDLRKCFELVFYEIQKSLKGI